MPKIVLVGGDLALLEGIAQTLASGGYRTQIAPSIDEGVMLAAAQPPLIALVQRSMAIDYMRHFTLRVPLAPGGSLLFFHGVDETPQTLPAPLQRITLADLTLPLERHRLVALVRTVDERARNTGRDRPPTPPETRAI